MAQTNQFNSIIKRVSKNDLQKFSGKKVIVENNSGKVVDKEAFLSFSGTYSYYIVLTNKSFSFTSSVFSITGTDNRKIKVFIETQIVCKDGKEKKVVESLHQIDEHPGNKFDSIIEDWVLEITDANPNLIDSFIQNRQSLTDKLVTKVENEVGLTLRNTRCFIEGENELETIHIALKQMSLRFADSVEEHSFDIDISLLVDEANKVNAIARSKTRTEFERIFEKKVREYFLNQVRIENIYSNYEKVKEDFKLYVKESLKFYGRKLGAIELKDITAKEPPKTLNKTIPVDIKVPGYFPKSFKIENQIFITREDSAKFISNKPDDLEKWLDESVQNTVKEVYFAKTYKEIIDKKKELEDQVKQNLYSIVKKIGYKLDQIIIIPTFEELKLLKKIEFVIDDNFITKDQKEVKLKISIQGEGNESSEKITSYLSNIQNLPREIRGLVLSEVKQFIHKIDSSFFYENFDDTEDLQDSVKTQLTVLISNKLKQVFDVKIKYLTFDVGETEIIKRMNDLIEEWHEFEVEIQSLSDRKSNTFLGSFRVDGNARGLWRIYQKQKFSIGEIKERIVNSLQSRLSAYPGEYLSYRNPESLEFVEGLIKSISTQAVRESFGVEILVGTIRRGSTIEEKELDEFSDLIRDARKKALKDKINEIVDEGNIGEIDSIDELYRLEQSMIKKRLTSNLENNPFVAEEKLNTDKDDDEV